MSQPSKKVEVFFPLYEGKMFMPFDHQFADVIITDNIARPGQQDFTTLEDHLELPVLPPDRYTPELLDFIVLRVVELTYTTWDLQAFAQDILDEVGPETWVRWFADAPMRWHGQ